MTTPDAELAEPIKIKKERAKATLAQQIQKLLNNSERPIDLEVGWTRLLTKVNVERAEIGEPPLAFKAGKDLEETLINLLRRELLTATPKSSPEPQSDAHEPVPAKKEPPKLTQQERAMVLSHSNPIVGVKHLIAEQPHMAEYGISQILAAAIPRVGRAVGRPQILKQMRDNTEDELDKADPRWSKILAGIEEARNALCLPVFNSLTQVDDHCIPLVIKYVEIGDMMTGTTDQKYQQQRFLDILRKAAHVEAPGADLLRPNKPGDLSVSEAILKGTAELKKNVAAHQMVNRPEAREDPHKIGHEMRKEAAELKKLRPHRP